MEVAVLPPDEHNRALVDNTHPAEWESPEPRNPYNLVVIGAGTAGLVSAAGAATLGARVALVEKHLLGGDCLNYGCVPSKAIIRCATAAADARWVDRYGIQLKGEIGVDFRAVMARMRRLRSHISKHDSVGRFQKMGVDIFLGEARFTGPRTIEVDRRTLRFAKAVIATGGRPVAPPIAGLEEVGFLNNETVFSLTEQPKRLGVIGAGPIGCELAQAFQRLGTQVTVLQRGPHVLMKEDLDAAAVVQEALVRDGVDLILSVNVKRVESRNGEKVIRYSSTDGEEGEVSVDELLVAAGRAPNVAGMGLEQAGVQFDAKRGVSVNDRFQTSNSRIFAAGDVCWIYKFTHAADFMARAVLANALFMGRRKASALTIPWCTYTDPQIAHVGITEHDADETGIDVDTFCQPLEEVDRALLDGETEGFVKAHLKKGTDTILGATIVARNAGDMIGEFTMAIANKIGLGSVANVIHPYPTQAEAIRKTGDLYNKTRLTPRVKNLMGWWLRWQRGR